MSITSMSLFFTFSQITNILLTILRISAVKKIIIFLASISALQSQETGHRAMGV